MVTIDSRKHSVDRNKTCIFRRVARIYSHMIMRTIIIIVVFVDIFIIILTISHSICTITQPVGHASELLGAHGACFFRKVQEHVGCCPEPSHFPPSRGRVNPPGWPPRLRVWLEWQGQRKTEEGIHEWIKNYKNDGHSGTNTRHKHEATGFKWPSGKKKQLMGRFTPSSMSEGEKKSHGIRSCPCGDN